MRSRDPLGLVDGWIDGRIHCLEAVGEDGLATYYRAELAGVGAAVLVQLLPVPLPLHGPTLQDFLTFTRALRGRLAATTARIAGLQSVLDVGVHTTFNSAAMYPYIATTWTPGLRLYDVLARHGGQLPLAEVLARLRPVVGAVQALHQDGLTHEELSDKSVWVTSEGSQFSLIGIGSAQLSRQYVQAIIALEPAYADMRIAGPKQGAPEQFELKLGAITGRTDQFSLALLVTRLLIGRPALDSREELARLLNPASRPTPASMGFPLDARTDAVLARALAVNPVDRYGSVSAFWTALEEAAAASGQTRSALEHNTAFGADMRAATAPHAADNEEASRLLLPVRSEFPVGNRGESVGAVAMGRPAPHAAAPPTPPRTVPPAPASPSLFDDDNDGRLPMPSASVHPGATTGAAREPAPAPVARSTTAPLGAAPSGPRSPLTDERSGTGNGPVSMAGLAPPMASPPGVEAPAQPATRRRLGLVALGAVAAVLAMGATAAVTVPRRTSTATTQGTSQGGPALTPLAPTELAPAVLAPSGMPKAPLAEGTTAASEPSGRATTTSSGPSDTAPLPPTSSRGTTGPANGARTATVASSAPATTPTASAASSRSPQLADFEVATAMQALDALAPRLGECRRADGPRGRGRAQVLFAPASGRVSSISVSQPFADDSEGACIVQLFSTAHVPPFAADSVRRITYPFAL